MNNSNEPVSVALYQIVKQYGPDIFTNPNRTITLLKDYVPKHEKEVKLIATAFREGIANQLLDVANQNAASQKQRIEKCTYQMVDDLYLTKDAAQFAVMAIAYALGLNTDSGSQISEVEQSTTTEDAFFCDEITISSPLIISADESVVFSGKNIHLQSSIYCEGNLSFENCTLHCREVDTNYGVTLAETGTLSIFKCTIRNHSNGEPYFFTCENSVCSLSDMKSTMTMSFKHCEFIDCCTFIYGSVFMEHCRILNPGSNFINGGDFEVHIGNSEFSIKTMPLFISNETHIIGGVKLHFSECLVYGTQEDAPGNTIDQFIGHVAHCYIEHCVFRCLNYTVISAYGPSSIRLSVFDQCKSLLGGDGKFNIEDCRFDGCATLGVCGGTIVRCQFNPSIGNLKDKNNSVISGLGGVQINACEFNNWDGKNGKNMIHFSCCGDRTEINQCIFRGMKAGEGFVIVGDGAENPHGVINVTNCKFINCTTKRESGQIIRHYDTYFTFFSREKRVQTVYVRDCMGLDQINSGGSGVVGVISKTHTANGDVIGLTDESAVGI